MDVVLAVYRRALHVDLEELELYVKTTRGKTGNLPRPFIDRYLSISGAIHQLSAPPPGDAGWGSGINTVVTPCKTEVQIMPEDLPASKHVVFGSSTTVCLYCCL